jgi:hypothetical protein
MSTGSKRGVTEPASSDPAIPDRVRRLLDGIAASNVRFIKLGRKSIWWPLARDTNTLRLGFRQFDFALCRAGKWKEAEAAFAAMGLRARQADVTRAVNQVRAFFELPEQTLWITIENGDVWWCFAEEEIINLYDGDDEKERLNGARMRRVIDCWRNTDVNGKRLRLDSMTTKITKVASFQETIAKPDGAADLLNRVRGIQSPAHALTANTLDALTTAVGDLLDQLHQDDFELLIELIFSSSGWKRISAVGGIQKTLDIAMTLPTTGEHCFVQVKSYHTPATGFANTAEDRVTVWHRYEIARQAIRAGLVDWILARTT